MFLSISSSKRPCARGGGRFIGELIHWLIMVVIYEICIGTISAVFDVSRFVAAIIFLGILLALSFGGYLLRQQLSSPADQEKASLGS